MEGALPWYSDGIMLDHMTILVKDYRRSVTFYLQALKPLGYAMTLELDDVTYPHLPSAFFAGLGVNRKADLWLRPSKIIAPTHVAFRAESRAIVDAFYREAIAAGGTANGAPGLRSEYDPNYYAAFVLDPDGYNVEAVCHEPE
jgi:catechol 2,3-dioxygenase-like lactoylglutathione lyase family enzyme